MSRSQANPHAGHCRGAYSSSGLACERSAVPNRVEAVRTRRTPHPARTPVATYGCESRNPQRGSPKRGALDVGDPRQERLTATFTGAVRVHAPPVGDGRSTTPRATIAQSAPGRCLGCRTTSGGKEIEDEIALFATCTALVMSAFGASAASPAADPQNFRVSLRVTLVSCQGGNLLDCSFEGSAMVPHLGRATVTGSIAKGCVIPLDYCIWNFDATLTPSGAHGGRTLTVVGSVQWFPNEPPPAALPWDAREDSGYAGHGTSTDDFSYQLPYGSEFTINLMGTLRPAN
jgi:hypothetical protein